LLKHATWSRAFLAALTLTAAGLLYLVTLRLLFIPQTRSIEVETESSGAGRLKVYPDVGRGFYDGDALSCAVSPASKTYSLKVRFRTTAARIELLSPDPSARIVAASVTGLGDSTLLEGIRESSTVYSISSLPRLTDGLSIWQHLLSASLATALALVALMKREWRDRAGRALSRLLTDPRPFSCKRTALLWALLAAMLWALATCAEVFHVLVHHIDDPPHFPISVYDARAPTFLVLLSALGLLSAAAGAIHLAVRGRLSVKSVAVVALTVLVTTNLLYGWRSGYVLPTAGPQMYFADAKAIRSAANFLYHFNDRQLTLRTHSRTHPPGAVLLYYALLQITRSPGVISLALGVASFAAVLAFTYGIVCPRAGHQAAGLVVLVLAFAPAIQVYFISSLDAVICATCIGTLYCFVHRASVVRYSGTLLLLTLTMSLSFASLLLFPVLAAYDVVVRRTARTFLVVAGLSALVSGAVGLATNFQWLASLLTAAHYENPGGFALFRNPGSYLFTRLEDVAEICLFAGPLLLVAWARGLGARPKQDQLALLSVSSALVLGLMFLTGAFKTGETARACLFVLPTLALPLATLSGGDRTLAPGQWQMLATTLAAQAIAMQVVGDYYW